MDVSIYPSQEAVHVHMDAHVSTAAVIDGERVGAQATATCLGCSRWLLPHIVGARTPVTPPKAVCERVAAMAAAVGGAIHQASLPAAQREAAQLLMWSRFENNALRRSGCRFESAPDAPRPRWRR